MHAAPLEDDFDPMIRLFYKSYFVFALDSITDISFDRAASSHWPPITYT